MFGKGVDTASMNKQGSGLGLSFCKSMIEKMGGQIALTSTYGKGAEVRFYIIPEAIELKELYVESVDALPVTDRNKMNTIRQFPQLSKGSGSFENQEQMVKVIRKRSTQVIGQRDREQPPSMHPREESKYSVSPSSSQENIQQMSD